MYIKYNDERKLHPIYNSWRGMRNRCYDEKNQDYYNYGAKGIKICDEWKDNYDTFYEWFVNQPYYINNKDESEFRLRPSIDRIDPNKDYHPANCQIISVGENSSRAWFGKTHSDETKRKMSDAKPKRSIIAIHIETGEIVEFESLNEGGRDARFSQSGIDRACRGKYGYNKDSNIYKKFQWNFK